MFAISANNPNIVCYLGNDFLYCSLFWPGIHILFPIWAWTSHTFSLLLPRIHTLVATLAKNLCFCCFTILPIHIYVFALFGLGIHILFAISARN